MKSNYVINIIAATLIISNAVAGTPSANFDFDNQMNAQINYEKTHIYGASSHDTQVKKLLHSHPHSKHPIKSKT